jgi:hypothetical protein
MPPKYGSQSQKVADEIQARRFNPLMSGEGQSTGRHGIVQCERAQALKVPLFLVLQARQPREAWILGQLAGWPECRLARA